MKFFIMLSYYRIVLYCVLLVSVVSEYYCISLTTNAVVIIINKIKASLLLALFICFSFVAVLGRLLL